MLGQGAPAADRLGRLEALVGSPVGLGGPLLLGAGTRRGLTVGQILVRVASGHAGAADVHGSAGPAGVDLGELVVFGLAQRPAQPGLGVAGGRGVGGPGAHEVRVAAAHAGVQAVGAHVVDVPGPGAVDDPGNLAGGDGGVVGVGGCGAFVDELEGVGLEFLGQVAPVGHVGQGGDAPGAGGPDPVQDIGHVGLLGQVESHPGRANPAGSVPSAVGGARLGQVGGTAHQGLSLLTTVVARTVCGRASRLRRRVVGGRWRRSPRPCRAGLGGGVVSGRLWPGRTGRGRSRGGCRRR